MAKKKPGPGRPLDDTSGAKTPRTVWLSPAEVDHLVELAGSIGEGLRGLVAKSMASAKRRMKGARK